MMVTCDECNIEMGRINIKRFVNKYQCSKCGKVITVDDEAAGYEALEEY